MHRHLILPGLAALVLAAALTGCSAPKAATPTSTPAAAAIETPAPVATVAAPTSDNVCNPGDGPHYSTDVTSGGTLDVSAFTHMRDLGPRDAATGKATSRDGHPATYTVASGDVAEVVAARFCLPLPELAALNAVRFNSITTVQPGDVLNLSPYTVATVGGRPGAVTHNDPGFELPTR